MKRSSTVIFYVGASAILLVTVPGARRAAGAFARTLVQFITGGAL